MQKTISLIAVFILNTALSSLSIADVNLPGAPLMSRRPPDLSTDKPLVVSEGSFVQNFSFPGYLFKMSKTDDIL
jgi:hypothetical protein